MFSSAFKSFTSNITSNYDVSKQPSATVGVWNIFDAKKKSTGAQASVYVFDRKSLDVSNVAGFGAKASSTSVRKAQDEVVERLKKEAGSLARLRHPSILQLVEPVEETRSGGLMFATEPVIASLGAALSQRDRGNGQSRRSEPTSRALQNVEIDELEIQKGLLQIAKGLEFLHDSAKLVHGNLSPDAIFINAKSDWKLSGLAFAGPPDNAEGHQTVPQISLSEVLHNDARVPPTVQLNLDYTSPDFVLDSNINFSADIFSLGLILLACYREPHQSPIETHGSQSTYKKVFSSASTSPSPHNNYLCSNKLPRELESTLPRVLARRPAGRMSASEFQQSEYFDNILVNTMRFLDGFPAKTPAEKSSFMRGLGKVMPQFPVSVLERKILSVLLDEMKDRDLLALILQNTFQIIQVTPNRKDVLSSKVLPRLRDTFTATAKSTERDASKEAGLNVFLEHIRLVSENSSAQQFKEDALPIVHVALQSSTHQLVDAALQTLSTILPVLDFSTVKHDLFPVVATVFTKTSSMGIKIGSLEALSVLCGATNTPGAGRDDDFGGTTSGTEAPNKNVSSLDKFTLQEKVVPLLKGIKTKEPAVMMAALKVFHQVVKVGDIDFLATEVMPILWTFALGPLLNLSQFKAYMDIIKNLTQKIEKEQVRKLQELAGVSRSESQARAVSPSMQNGSLSRTNGTSGAEDDFERLVLGSKTGDRKDPFAGALTDGQKLVQNAPSYSWASESGAATPAVRAGILHPRSRSITPDVSMASFPSLQPGSSASAWTQSTQPAPKPTNTMPQPWNAVPSNPSQPMAPTTMTSSPLWGQTLTPQAASSSSRLQPTNFLNPTSSPNVPQHIPSATSNFSPLLAPPPQSPPPANAWQQQGTVYAGLNTLQPQRQQPPQQQQPPKQAQSGLDKYQSLL